jgi:adenine deaminase
MNIPRLQSLLAVARGEAPADVLLTNARVVNTFSMEVCETSVAIYDGLVAGFGERAALKIVDLRGAFLAPSFIDGHIHIESSLLSPAEFARVVVTRGTGAVVCDPHEITNVHGAAGIQYMLDASELLPLDVFVMLPSCVPATHMETAGAVLKAENLKPFLSHPRVLGIAEVMNFPGVVFGDESVLQKIALAEGRPIDGHAPGISDQWLDAYSAAGIETDHECTVLEEAREKLRRGMNILIREGSTARNLEALLPLISRETAHHFAFISDDRHADDLLHDGHLNATLTKAVAQGLDPLLALSLVTTNPAAMFRRRDLGVIAPGRRANFVVLENLKNFRALGVWHDGNLVAENGAMIVEVSNFPVSGVSGSVRIPQLSPQSLAIPATGKQVHIIDLIPDQIVTNRSVASLPVVNGSWQANRGQDIAKIVVIERHGQSGKIGKGFVRGFNLNHGALASTVAHDSHNLICVGTNDADMLAAIHALEQCGGGLAVATEQKVQAVLPLPIAGLMSDRPVQDVVNNQTDLHRAARALGCTLSSPFMALAFLALPVIPHLKITDHGLVDVDAFKEIDLAES